MELSNRLRKVADMVKKGEMPADIGCDHGYVSIYLVKEHICNNVIAMDINKGPLLRAREHISKEGLGPYIETRLSDGAAALKEKEADTLICAGMGGKLIIHILEDAVNRLTGIKAFILQPQSEIWLVRRFLSEHHFLIVQEEMVFEEGKYYPMMRAERTEAGANIVYSKKEEIYGPLLLKEKHPVLFQYLLKEKKAVLETIERLLEEKSEKNFSERQVRIEELQEKLQCIEECLSGF